MGGKAFVATAIKNGRLTLEAIAWTLATTALVYDLPTYADLDLVASDPSYFASQYGISFTDVKNMGWSGNFTSSSSGSLSPGYQNYLFFDSVHPTALAHQLTADIAYHTLTTAPLA